MKLADQTSQSLNRVMTWDDTFEFGCHTNVDCFNSCCRDVTIFLHPLDVIRMRKALGISSEDFLEQYTHKVVSSKSGLPAVVLKMNADEAKKCPFVSESGCTIYESRPYSCRLYPLDTEQGVEYTFIVGPERCHGLQESQTWTVERWRREQGLYEYDDLDHDLKDVMSAHEQWEAKIEDVRMQNMFLMALYDPDRFREFVFNSSFLSKFHVDEEILQKIRNEDVALLYFAAQWLRFALFGKKGFLKIDRDFLEQKKREVLNSKEPRK